MQQPSELTVDSMFLFLWIPAAEYNAADIWVEHGDEGTSAASLPDRIPSVACESRLCDADAQPPSSLTWKVSVFAQCSKNLAALRCFF